MESIAVGAMALGTASRSACALSMPYDLDCLLDLPPMAKDSVRIYLCRHAQTENNRLSLVQGARVDPPINYSGIQQSLRLGSALSSLKENCPQKILHSSLVRSKETAEFAARNILDKPIELAMLPSLAEVDFGPVAEGQPVSDVRGEMLRVTGAWVSGYIDTRPDGGGESGREVSSLARQDIQAPHLEKILQADSFFF
jgi:broad specificity phosphatase PhoE